MRVDALTLRVLLGVAIVLAAAGLAACGGVGSGPPAIRVGGAAIAKRAVDHWSSIVRRGALVANVTGSTRAGSREQALALLIDSAWLEGEAAREGLRPARGEIAKLVDEQRATNPGGAAGFEAALAESGQTLADVEAESRAKWAAGALARRLEEAVDRYASSRVGERAVARFYRKHIARYHHPEQRYYDLYEQLRTRAQAVVLARKLRSGEPVGMRPNKENPYRPRSFRDLPGQAVAYRAVFAATRLNVVVGPLPLQNAWCLFILRRVVPARLQPLAEVRGSIERELREQLRARERTRLIAAYRQRWLSRTYCRPGYVVQRCREFKGPRRHEPPPFAGF